MTNHPDTVDKSLESADKSPQVLAKFTYKIFTRLGSEVINLQTYRYEFKVEGLGLRWNTNSTPSSTIQDIHFKSGLNIAEALSLSSGRVELTVLQHEGAVTVLGFAAPLSDAEV